MAVERANVEKLQEWLADGSPARSEYGLAESVVTELARLVFDGDEDWPDSADRVGGYRDDLRAWFLNGAGAAELEARFAMLTGPGADPGQFFAWFPAALAERERAAAAGALAADGEQVRSAQVEAGLQNPNCDGTPGTEYYRFEQATGAYLYADRADGSEWATYEQRRYSDPARDENYGLQYRFDRKDSVYEWFDEAAQAWQPQTWADQRRVGRDSGTSAERSEAAWDEGWGMFYRLGPGGVYEYAHSEDAAHTRPVEPWLSGEQVLQQRALAGREAETEVSPTSEQAELTPREVIRRNIPEIAEIVPGFDTMSDDQIARAVAAALS